MRELLTPRVSFILQKYPISLVDMGFFHVRKEDLQMKITIEPLEFPLCVKEKLMKIPKISKLHIEFVNGKNIHFDKTNLSINEPHKVIISNDSSCIILLSYPNDNNLYLKDSLEIITLESIKFLILKML